MNVSFKKSLLVAALSTGMLAASAAQAEFSANIGATSNYMWRGLTQTADEAAISGGLDFAAESGVYVGTWASSLGGGQYELDLYGGYAGEAGSFGYDVGVITYLYPLGEDEELDFTEVYASGSVGGFGAGVAVQVAAEDDDAEDAVYFDVSYGFDVSEDVGMSIYAGLYDYEDSDSVTNYGVSLSKGDFTMALDATDKDNTDEDPTAEDPRISVSWGTSF